MEKENTKVSSRRDFFKKSGAIAGGLLLVSMLDPLKQIKALAGEKPKGKGAWYGIGVDLEKCIGCGSCAKACKTENNVPKEPFFFRSWVEQYSVTANGVVKVQSPNGGVDGFKQPVLDKEIEKSFFIPKSCNHCAKSPCEQVCPVGATFISPDGVVLVDETYCIGCGYCVQACPYACRYLHPVKHTADKCTLCYHRIKKGLAPACITVCPTGAKIYGDLNDKNSDLVKFIKEHNCTVLKPHLNTKPKFFYNALKEEAE